MGVMMGEEIERPWGALFFLGDLRKLSNEEPRDCFSSFSWERLRLEGLFLRMVPGVAGAC